MQLRHFFAVTRHTQHPGRRRLCGGVVPRRIANRHSAGKELPCPCRPQAPVSRHSSDRRCHSPCPDPRHPYSAVQAGNVAARIRIGATGRHGDGMAHPRRVGASRRWLAARSRSRPAGAGPSVLDQRTGPCDRDSRGRRRDDRCDGQCRSYRAGGRWVPCRRCRRARSCSSSFLLVDLAVSIAPWITHKQTPPSTN